MEYHELLLNLLENCFDATSSDLKSLYSLVSYGNHRDILVHIHDRTCVFNLWEVVEQIVKPEGYHAETWSKRYNIVEIPGLGHFFVLGELYYRMSKEEANLDGYSEKDEDYERDLLYYSEESPFQVLARVRSAAASNNKIKAGGVYLVRRPECTSDDLQAFGHDYFNIAKVADDYRHFLYPDESSLVLTELQTADIVYTYPKLRLHDKVAGGEKKWYAVFSTLHFSHPDSMNNVTDFLASRLSSNSRLSFGRQEASPPAQGRLEEEARSTWTFRFSDEVLPGIRRKHFGFTDGDVHGMGHEHVDIPDRDNKISGSKKRAQGILLLALSFQLDHYQCGQKSMANNPKFMLLLEDTSRNPMHVVKTGRISRRSEELFCLCWDVMCFTKVLRAKQISSYLLPTL